MLAGQEPIDDIVSAPVAAQVNLRPHTPATGLDLAARTVHTPGTPDPYDALPALGPSASRPEQDERVLRSQDDGVRLAGEAARASSVLAAAAAELRSVVCAAAGRGERAVERRVDK